MSPIARRSLFAAMLCSAPMVLGVIAAPAPQERVAPPGAPTPPRAVRDAASPAPGPATRQFDRLAPDERAAEVARLLDNAALAMAARQFFSPPRSSARHYYEAALALDPGNARANAGLDRLTEIILERATTALSANQLSTAVSQFESARDLRPGHRLIPLFEEQLHAERSRLITIAGSEARLGNFTAASTLLSRAAVLPGDPASIDDIVTARDELAELRRAADALETEEIDRAELALQQEILREEDQEAEQERLAALNARLVALTEQARSAIEASRLLAPEWNSARQLLNELAFLPVDPLVLARLQAAYLNRLVDGTDERIRRGDLQAASEWLTEIRDVIGPDDARAQRLQGDLDEALYRAETLRVASLKEFEFSSYVEPRYPASAEQFGNEGWVDVEFTVLTDGRVADVIVLDSSRTGSFRSAAVAAVRQWQLEPRAYLGRPISQRVRTRVTFRLGEQ